MRAYDIIAKKKVGNELTDEEINFIVQGFTNGEIPDYQMSALLMAICLKGMTKKETATLTMSMANSGDIVDLSAIKGIKVDKHSTGGVGDKTTLVISPMIASIGVPVAKMSGRGLGHTGGTVDKLESIPNLKTSFTREEFIAIVNEAGVCVAGQSGNLAPADKKIYALRDVTATVDSIPLIAASIMSKKIAAGSDAILLDVKTGSGAFMKTIEDSISLAKAMVEIGESVGRKTVALVTNMDIPLGNAIGNTLEIIEVVETLKGNGPKDLTEISMILAKEMAMLGEKGTELECENILKNTLNVINGTSTALDKFAQMVKYQSGHDEFIRDTTKFENPSIVHEVKSKQTGYIYKMDTEGCGIASSMLGAGRETENSLIDFSAGIILKSKTGDYVNQGETIATFYTSDENKINSAEEKFNSSLTIKEEKPEESQLIYARVDKGGVTRF